MPVRCQDWLGEPPALQNTAAKQPVPAQDAQDDVPTTEQSGGHRQAQVDGLQETHDRNSAEHQVEATLQVTMPTWLTETAGQHGSGDMVH